MNYNWRFNLNISLPGTHYKIKIKISDSDESRLHGGEIGTISVIIKGHHDTETEKMPISQHSM